MGLRDLSLRNCRGIDALDIQSLARVNLIGGRNNSGKSSILEAILLLSKRRDASAIPNINSIVRKVSLSTRDDVSIMFHDDRHPIEVSAVTDDGVHSKVSVKLMDGKGGEIRAGKLEGEISKSASKWVVAQRSADRVNGKVVRSINVKFESKLDDSGEMVFPYTSDVKNDSYDWRCIFMSADARNNLSTVKRFSAATVELKDKEIIQAVSRIYNEIFTIKIVDDKLMAKMRGYDKLLPLNVAGDGVVRIFSVLCSLWTCKNGCLCVDEIDNGLHYSVLLPFWNAVLDFAIRYNVQLFATTHHLDALETLNRVARESDCVKDIAYYRIVNDGEFRHSVSRFSGDELDRAIKLGFELRG